MSQPDWAAQYEAPEGKVWQCRCCGKNAINKATGGISPGWDESCYLHAELVDDVLDVAGPRRRGEVARTYDAF